MVFLDSMTFRDQGAPCLMATLLAAPLVHQCRRRFSSLNVSFAKTYPTPDTVVVAAVRYLCNRNSMYNVCNGSHFL